MAKEGVRCHVSALEGCGVPDWGVKEREVGQRVIAASGRQVIGIGMEAGGAFRVASSWLRIRLVVKIV